MPKRFRRTKYFIAAKFQMKFVGMILLFMFVIALFSALIIYYSTWMVLGEKLANVYPQGRLAGILRHANYVLFWILLLVSPLVAFVGVMLSHRIAGPIYRLRKNLEEIAGGNYSLRISLRKTDELKDVADAINKVVDVLQAKHTEAKNKK